MKILLVADKESPYLWDYYQPGRLKDIDLILSSGDLKPEYLSFLVTMCTAPLLYVHGNHDARYEKHPPEGCVCIDDQLVKVGGLRILGMGGSMRYSHREHQYTDAEMERRLKKMRFALHRAGGVDILLTHAPARGIGDGQDLCHRGFQAFLPFMDKYHPKYWLHGHMHLSYGIDKTRVREYNGTKVINASERYVLEIPDSEIHPTNKKGDIDYGHYSIRKE
mgnify:CR=1 FL=1